MFAFVVTGEGGEKVQRFKKWFWSIVEKMNPSERQDLVIISFFFQTINISFLFHLLLPDKLPYFLN